MDIDKLTKILKESKAAVFFGGAGVSTASGIPDFRSSTGLYSKRLNKNFTPEQVVSNSFFRKYPKEFFEFYRKYLIYPDAQPNACHLALAQLEKMKKLKAIVTQNIDGLHQAAGSSTVYELHGSVLRNYCMKCHAFYDVNYVLQANQIPICEECGGVIKPDVVLYEEALDEQILTDSLEAIKKADTLIIGGTSLAVYPAAGLIHYFGGRHIVVINKSMTPVDRQVDVMIQDDIVQVMQSVMREL